MDDINHPIVKAAVAASSFVGLTWIDWLTTTGKVCAALVSVGLLMEFAWKKALRPFARRMGWVKKSRILMLDDIE